MGGPGLVGVFQDMGLQATGLHEVAWEKGVVLLRGMVFTSVPGLNLTVKGLQPYLVTRCHIV